MKSDADQPWVTESRPGLKPNAKNDLISLPLPELQARLGSSPDRLSQAEAQKWLTQYGPNEIEEKKTNPFLKFLTYFWGPIPWTIEAAEDRVVAKIRQIKGVKSVKSHLKVEEKEMK